MRTIEAIFLSLFVAFLWGILFFLSSGPLTWDELWYLDLSVFPEQVPALFFRYFHIYLQRIFILISVDPITGAKLYGSFCISMTAGLVYYSVRLLIPKSGPLPAILAFVIFISQTLVLRYLGVTWADTTLMLLLMAMSAVYLKMVTQDKCHQNMIFLFGILLYFAIRTKEAGVVLGVLVLGWGWHTYCRGVSTQAFRRKCYWFIFGIVAGHATIVALDTLWLGSSVGAGTSVASMDINNIGKALSIDWGYLTGKRVNDFGVTNWIARLAGEDMILLASIYLLSLAVLLSKENKIALHFLWILPLVMLLFLSLTSGVRRWIFESRYLIVFTPFFALFPVYYLDKLLCALNRKTQVRTLVGSVVFALFMSVSIVIGLHEFTEGIFSDGARHIVNSILIPVCVILIIGSLTFLPFNPKISVGIVLIALLVGSFYPVLLSARIVQGGLNRSSSETRFYPIMAFKDQVSFSESKKILISRKLYSNMGMLGRNISSCKWMFEIALEEKFQKSQFSIVSLTAMNEQYDFLLLSADQEISEDAIEGDDYHLLREPTGRVLLVVRKNAGLLK